MLAHLCQNPNPPVDRITKRPHEIKSRTFSLNCFIPCTTISHWPIEPNFSLTSFLLLRILSHNMEIACLEYWVHHFAFTNLVIQPLFVPERCNCWRPPSNSVYRMLFDSVTINKVLLSCVGMFHLRPKYAGFGGYPHECLTSVKLSIANRWASISPLNHLRSWYPV